MTYSRRDTFRIGGALSLTSMLAGRSNAKHSIGISQTVNAEDTYKPAIPDIDYKPVITPNGATLPFKVVDGVKVFHLIAEEVMHSFADGLSANCWGYNGHVHGPTIEAMEGDTIRVYVTNRLPAPTTVHWHGIILPSGMDGVGGLNQPPIEPEETFFYEFKLKQHGTFMYHSHHDEMTQMAMGMMGMIVIHPRQPANPVPDRDYVMMLSEWSIKPGTHRPDPNEMSDFNVLTFNARAFPGTEPLQATLGERVRIRFGNLSAMDHHPIHLHGYAFHVTETDGGPIPEAAQWPETTVLVPTGATRTIEFVADNPGDWAMHCHMTHHVMNQMGHELDLIIGTDPQELSKILSNALPDNMIMGANGMGDHGVHIEKGHMVIPDNSIPMIGGQGPMGYITMGGMFTILKVRSADQAYSPDTWYREKPHNQARLASAEELKRDGIYIIDE
ncbi:multicopper oxidase family protein [Kordiimonas aquimaris]|uniref:multicopper oxidase family protein n=1 Tax=Kordiimonas aquimaris TaxID=707591 RepID=UPI0021D2F903|nr:copper oxidase [Kordiimonas aquimaris]